MFKINQKPIVKVVAHPETGEVLNPTSNEDFLSFRVDSEAIELNNGFLTQKQRVAFVKVPTKQKHIYNGLKDGMELPGKIIVTERAGVPFYEGQEPKINPESGEVLQVNGVPIYRETTYTLQEDLSDTLVSHDRSSLSGNSDAIKEAIKAEKKAKTKA